MSAFGKLGGAVKSAAKGVYDRGVVKKGVDAFRNFKQKKQKPLGGGMAATQPSVSPGKPTVPKIGSFEVGRIEPNLQLPKPSAFGRGAPFKTGM